MSKLTIDDNFLDILYFNGGLSKFAGYQHEHHWGSGHKAYLFDNFTTHSKFQRQASLKKPVIGISYETINPADLIYFFKNISIISTYDFKCLTVLTVIVPAEITDFSIFTKIKTLETLRINFYKTNADRIYHIDLPDNITTFAVGKYYALESDPAYYLRNDGGCRYMSINSKKLKILMSSFYIINLYELQTLELLQLLNWCHPSRELPDICLPNLIKLVVRYSNIITMPNFINCENLKELYISSSQLSNIPESFNKMFMQLDQLTLDNNKLTKLMIPNGSNTKINVTSNDVREVVGRSIINGNYFHNVLGVDINTINARNKRDSNPYHL